MKRIGWRISGWWGRLIIASAVFVVAASAAPAASAADSILWTNTGGGTISIANLDGSSNTPPPTLNTGSVTPEEPEGVAPDPATGKVYWADLADSIIYEANLTGGGAAPLIQSDPHVKAPVSMVVDHNAGKIYWANTGNSTIAEANLDGSGVRTIPTGVAVVKDPHGIAVDPAAGKIYWSNRANTSNSDAIGFAKLDLSNQGNNLTIMRPTVTKPFGLVIDRSAGKLIWGTFGNSPTQLEFANFDGTGGQNLWTPGADQKTPWPGAIDPRTAKLYWTNFGGGSVSDANVDDGTGGENLYSRAGVSPTFAAVLARPGGIVAPKISGGTVAPTTLSCSQGTWASDTVSASFYRAPRSFATSWFKNGAPIPGATSGTLSVTSGGSYRCQVTATNFAGSATQSSSTLGVASPPPPPTVSATGSTSNFTATVTVSCAGVSGQSCSGPISLTAHQEKLGSKTVGVSAQAGAHVVGVTARKHKHKHKPKQVSVQVTVGSGSYSVAAGRSVNVPIPLNATGRLLLGRFFTMPTTLTLPGTSAAPRVLTFSLPRIHVVTGFMHWAVTIGSFTTAQQLVLKPLPSGAEVKIGCDGGGCPFGKKSTHATSTSLKVTKLFGKHHLKPGAKVTFAISAVNHIGELLTYRLTGRPNIGISVRCLPPGSQKAVRG